MISEIKLKAKGLLKGNMGKIWGMLLITTGIILLINYIINLSNIETRNIEIINGTQVSLPTVPGFIIDILKNCISTIFTVAISYYIINLIRKKECTYTDSLSFALKNALKIIAISLLVSIIEIVGFMLFIIPGIILSLGLSIVYYILIDNPELGIIDTIKLSWNTMKGHKSELFLFILSFIGWGLLCIFLIPIIYVLPYMIVAEVLFYEKIKSTETFDTTDTVDVINEE